MRAHQLLTRSAIDHADHTALHWVDRDRLLTYAEAVDAMNRAAAALAQFGVGAGGCVGMFAHPGLDYVVGLLGAWRLGAAAALVDLAQKERFAELMVAVGPEAIVYTNDHFEFVEPAMALLPGVRAYAGMDGRQRGTVGWLETLAKADPGAVPADDDIDVLAHISFPPAATHEAKVTHGDLLTTASMFANRLGIDASDVTMCPTPLAGRFHLKASILPALATGASAGMLKTWEPESGWDAMEEHGSTVLCGHPEHCADVLDVSVRRGRAPSTLRIGVTSRGDGAGDVAARFRDELDIELLVA